ncbi:MAG TPA: hypothetical protein VFG49_07790 [Dyella sp.]|uniref:hypothetical protein n=1 Tax=Dyella sp. TaxID=1869338 RepID=UPI002D792B1A|nr:hypothetical protein [Dyella sp.]HET6553421.1 hypothetical protein [Dyella sp.]
MSKLHLSQSHLFAVALAVVALPVSGMAQQTTEEPAVHSTAAELQREKETVTATVTAIDAANRLITLRGPDGKDATIEAGPEVKNFDQLHVGDQVTTTYEAAVAVQVMPAGSADAGTDVQRTASTAAKGEKPGLHAGHTVTVTSKLTALDLKAHTMTLTGADGKERVIQVKDPERQKKLAELKVGDMVLVTYVEAFTIKVTPKAKGS